MKSRTVLDVLNDCYAREISADDAASELGFDRSDDDINACLCDLFHRSESVDSTADILNLNLDDIV